MLNIAKDETLEKLLGCSMSSIQNIIKNIDSHYTVTTIQKPNGGKRVIEASSLKLKSIQRNILLLLRRFPLSECAYGSVKGKSNKSNAYSHRENSVIFQSDLRSFYPSVHHTAVYRVFQDILGCTPHIARILTRLCTYDDHLPTGSPVSPYLANILMTETDSRLAGLARAYGLVYTRYMDDITLSGKCIPDKVIDSFYGIMKNSGFELHFGKTGIRAKDKPQVITGIGINRHRLKVPRKYKARIRALVNAGRDGLIPKDVVEKRLAGMQAYIQYVEDG